MKRVILAVITLCISACVATATYTPPIEENEVNKYSITLDKPFDEVWKQLINYSGSTFFGIDNFEKASGLITLSFGADQPWQFITGGYWKYNNQTQPQIKFEGDYVEYMTRYRNSRLTGKMNIVVTSLGETTTQVKVTSRYVFFSPRDAYSGSTSWAFNTGACSTVMLTHKTWNTPDTRTICPTYKAEDAVITALKG